MHWLLQEKFTYEAKYQELISNLERMGIPYTMCSVIPFSEDGIKFPDGITYDTFKDTPVFAFGSYTLAKIAKKYFKPASFISPKLGNDYLLENYGEEMFNHDMVIAPLKDLDTDMKEFFIRPVEDTKSFCGCVMDIDQFRLWRDNIIESSKLGYVDPSPDTMCVISSKKKINTEYRFFIVNGKIASCSQYKMNGEPYFLVGAEDYVVAYVNKMIGWWQPDHAYCLDIAVSNGVPKVLEANSINASGMYKIDTQKLIMAVEELNYCPDEYVHDIRLVNRTWQFK